MPQDSSKEAAKGEVGKEVKHARDHLEHQVCFDSHLILIGVFTQILGSYSLASLLNNVVSQAFSNRIDLSNPNQFDQPEQSHPLVEVKETESDWNKRNQVQPERRGRQVVSADLPEVADGN